MTKSRRNQRPRRTGGHIAEEGGLEKRNRDHREGGVGNHHRMEGQVGCRVGRDEKSTRGGEVEGRKQERQKLGWSQGWKDGNGQ